MNKNIFLGLVLAVAAAVAVFIVMVYLVDIGGIPSNDDNDAVTAIESTSPPIRVTVDINNGFICYDNMNSIACYPLMWGVPPPEAAGYIQGRIGHVFSFIVAPTPIPPTPSPTFLDGIN